MFRDRLILCLVLTVPILYLAEPVQGLLGYRAVSFPGLTWVSALLAIVLYFYGGWVFVRGAARELADRVPGMMTLIALAISVAFVYSLAVTLGLPGMPFYWELATLIDVMLLGHWLEMLSIQRASGALAHLAALIPPVAHRVDGDRVEDVPVGALGPGDRVLVRPGEQVPADGVVRSGASSLDEAFLTGESRPVVRQPGDEVVAGAINGEGALTIEVARAGDRTTLSQIVRLVEAAQNARSHFQALADRAAYWLTQIAVGVGTATFVVWLAVGAGLADAVTRAVTVLVIACPHALGLAIPLVIVNATALAARHGILVRDREAFERARELRVVAFDKTGTLTTGSFGVRAIAAEGMSEAGALALAGSLEVPSEHALGRALVEEAGRRGLALRPVEDFRAVPGRGIEGRVDGRAYRIGRPEWAAELGLALPPPLARALAEVEARGESAIVLVDEATPRALFALADQVRPGAQDAVQRLRAMGLAVVMMTGDAEAVARTVALDLGIARFYARVLPGDKAKLVETLEADGQRVAFVGDGINDAPALLTADLGVAIGAGTNVAIEAADLVLVDSNPQDVVGALQLARLTYGKMIENLLWATGYNVVAIPLAAGIGSAWGIVLSPAVGALLMAASTIVVAMNALLLRRATID